MALGHATLISAHARRRVLLLLRIPIIEINRCSPQVRLPTLTSHLSRWSETHECGTECHGDKESPQDKNMTALIEAVHRDARAEAELHLTPLAARIGAEVHGMELSGSLAGAAVAALKKALLKYRVLFFRAQHHLDDTEHEAFGRLWGELESHPTIAAPSGTTFLELDSRHGGRADSWHTDVTFRRTPPKLGILPVVKLPPVGGDTVWANTVAPFYGLPQELRTLAERLWAVHGNDYDYAATRNVEADDTGRKRYREAFVSTVFEAEHPVVRLHPETGERSLLLGHFVKRLVGYSGNDSRRLFEILQGHVVRLENTVRWRWQHGDVAVWDNRATQHHAINDYGDHHRVVRRVTVSGDAPLSVDGRRSVDRSAQVQSG